MFSKNLTWLVGSFSFSVFCVAMGSSVVACSSSTDTPSGAGGSTGGSGSGTGGSGSGGTGTTGGASNTGGASATGGASSTGGNGTGGSTGGAGSGGAGTGGTSGGSAGTGGTANGGSGGGNVGPGVADIPPAPGPGNVPVPSGTPGEITVLDWAGFPAAVTYSFDDNDGSQLDYYDQMHAIGGRYTYYMVSDWGLSDAGWKKIHDDGNEIGNHTTNHSCGNANIDGAATAIQTTFGEAPTTLAAPNGDSACSSQAPGRVFINRGVQPAQPVKPLDNSNPFALNCYIPATGQAASAYNGNIDSALSQNGWVIYVIHGIQPTSHSFQPVSWEGLKAAIEYAKSKDVWIDTMENIGSYWLGQKAFDAATSQTSGGSTTWTWTLPDKFPAGKYLRVTVEGGTLTQGGAPLTWDPHGYYEIELDKKTVTLAP